MKPTSRTSLTAITDQLAKVLAPLGNGQKGAAQTIELAEEFFAFSDALASSEELRRLLAEPATPANIKLDTLDRLLGDKANPIVLETAKAMAGAKWGDERDFGTAAEQIGRECLLVAATKAGQLEEVEKELFDLDHGMANYPDAVGFLSDPDTAPERRTELVRNLLAQTANPVTELLAARAALGPGSYEEKIAAIGDQIAKRRRMTLAKVTSAVELAPEQTERLERALSKKYGKAIEVIVKIDPDIIGGLRIEVGPYLIDDTVATRLADAMRKLSAKPSG